MGVERKCAELQSRRRRRPSFGHSSNFRLAACSCSITRRFWFTPLICCRASANLLTVTSEEVQKGEQEGQQLCQRNRTHVALIALELFISTYLCIIRLHVRQGHVVGI